MFLFFLVAIIYALVWVACELLERRLRLHGEPLPEDEPERSAPTQGQGRGRKASPDGKRSQIPFSLTELDRTRLDKAIAAAQQQSKFGVVNTQNFVEMAVKNAVTELIGES